MVLATAGEIKNYFEEKDASKFMREWKELSEEEQNWFREAVGKVLHPEQ